MSTTELGLSTDSIYLKQRTELSVRFFVFIISIKIGSHSTNRLYGCTESMNMSMKKIFLTLLGLLIANAASAHPHSFLDMKNNVLFAQDKLEGFAMSWILDEITSAELIYEINSSDNKKETIKKITEELNQSAVDAHYFSELYDEKDQPIKFKSQPTTPRIEVKNNRVIYHFTLSLATPQNVAGRSFRLFTFEPSYYLSMSYEQPQDVTSTPQSLCEVAMTEPKVSQSLRLYASKLDKTETPDMPDSGSFSLGAQFAQKVSIVCK